MTEQSRPKLGYLLSQYPSANHTYLLREVRALRAAGIDVTVSAVDGDSRPVAALTPEEVDERSRTSVVKRAGFRAILGAHAATLLTRPVAYLRGLGYALRLAGPDLRRIPYHALYFVEAVVAGRAFARAGCRHVHTHYATTVAVVAARVFAFEVSASIHGSAEFIEPRAQRLTEKVAACTFVRAISTYGLSQLMMASAPDHWGKLVVVRLGVDPGTFSAGPATGRPGPFRLASVGQLQPAKGFPLLLDALAALVGAGHDCTLTIVGGGNQHAELEARAARLGVSDRVTFTGPLNQLQVRAVLEQTDCFVLASFAEGIPVVLMEAMAAGVPCVASRITGIPELIEDGVSGLLVPPADAASLATAIDTVRGDVMLRERLGHAGRARIESEYNLQANVGHLVRVFRDRADL